MTHDQIFSSHKLLLIIITVIHDDTFYIHFYIKFLKILSSTEVFWEGKFNKILSVENLFLKFQMTLRRHFTSDDSQLGIQIILK